ncbi:hypothetical protein QBC37DRAFT_381506 [Rhypophila decipiens]|uniref:Uncharacterized protein n=1 Tax=Rhypophila decipiens TaxID=261697 RepID=A0AAN6XUW1_9PEZI|nr:hypothetical protein QBC37DRAFT_381506 [Rhypophila decipiens]
MHLPRAFGLVLSLAAGHVYAQTLQCATVPKGCDEGNTHEAVLRAAIARFNTSSIYGGRLDTFASAANEVGTLAQISYSCNDGSVRWNLGRQQREMRLRRAYRYQFRSSQLLQTRYRQGPRDWESRCESIRRNLCPKRMPNRSRKSQGSERRLFSRH